MKAIVLMTTVLFSTAAMAMVDMPRISNSDFPTESNWAKAMTQMACKVKFAKATTGLIETFNDGSVFYTVKVGSKVVAAATATSDYIWSKKTCVKLDL